MLQFDRDGGAGTGNFVDVVIMAGVTLGSLSDENFSGEFKLSGDPTGITLEGTAGDDIHMGTTLQDTLRGGAGNDKLHGQQSADRLEGGVGNDVLTGGSEDDLLFGEAGNDSLEGNEGNDVLDGGDGNDRLLDDYGDNTLIGGAGDDFIEASGKGRNLLNGGDGHDYLISRHGNDTVLGGAGHDVLEMDNLLPYYPWPMPSEPGAHTIILDAGEGTDIIRTTFHGDYTTVRATGGGGVDTFQLMYYAPGTGKYTITDFTGGAGGDVLDLLHFIPRYGALLNPFDPAANNLRMVQRGADLVLEWNAGPSGGAPVYKELVTLQNINAASLTSANFVGNIAPDGASGDLRLSGTAGVDFIAGGIFNDTIDGGAGADTLDGGRGNDIVNGGEGNDVLSGGFGKNTLNGGAGLDTAVYDYHRYMFDVSYVDGNRVFTNTGIVNSPVHRSDTWVSIERAKFDTQMWAFDVDGTGGMVYRLYEAAFNRAPDKIGVGFWMTMVDRGTLGMADVSNEFVKSAEFISLYGANPTSEQLVTRFYQNMLDREPDAVGKAFWIKVLDEKLATVAQVLSEFSESPENQANVAGIIGYGFEYIPYGGG